MPNTPIITISCTKDLRTNGDVVAGVLHLNLALAEKAEVTAVTVTLRGEINSHITVDQGAGDNCISTTHRDKVQLFTEKQTIWEPGHPLPSHSSGIASFPFSFTMPMTDLPPSFQGGTLQTGGSVQYYLHGVAARKPWYKRDVRVNQAFPFLPLDRTPAPSFLLPNWPGEWQIFSASKKMRRGVFSHHGLAVAELHMPKMPSVPLFWPIPIRLRVVCTSKQFPRSAADKPEEPIFPPIPKVGDIDLTLRQSCTVVVGSHHRRCTDNLGLQAGFGTPEKVGLRATWGDQVQISVTPPRWIIDETDKDKGRWSEDVTFSSTLFFRCPPPFSSPSLTSSVFLDLDVDFPGLGNKVKTEIGPLPLTSGIAPPRIPGSSAITSSPEVAVPSYGDSPREIDLPPTYYEVIVMQLDEKGGEDH